MNQTAAVNFELDINKLLTGINITQFLARCIEHKSCYG